MSGAIFSEDRNHRYCLWRFWNYQVAEKGEAKAVMFIMANASTAGDFNDDPTIRRCAGFGRDWGYDGMYIGNLFSKIETHWSPNMKFDENGVGEECDYYLQVMINSSAMHVAAWGFMGKHYPERAKEIRKMIPDLHYIELSKGGVPKHPLYLPSYRKPILWSNW